MSAALNTDKLTLPPIQLLLQNDVQANKPATSLFQGRLTLGHRGTRSVSSLPSDLQRLSLYPNASKDDSALGDTVSGNHAYTQNPGHEQAQASCLPGKGSAMTMNMPSWLQVDRQVVLPPPQSLMATPAPSAFIEHGPHHYRRPAGTSHSRSVSEYTLSPSTYGVSQPRTPAPLKLQTPRRQHSHRRTVSANTVDCIIQPSKSTSSSSSSSSASSPSNAKRAQSDSPPGQTLHSPPTATQSDFRDESMVQPQRDPQTGRYPCPYCNKGFSRPSSLLIHTYSHTGEKPFVCTEEGCGRRFSVQSNMRRHLRVHRLSRSTLKSA